MTYNPSDDDMVADANEARREYEAARPWQRHPDPNDPYGLVDDSRVLDTELDELIAMVLAIHAHREQGHLDDDALELMLDKVRPEVAPTFRDCGEEAKRWWLAKARMRP